MKKTNIVLIGLPGVGKSTAGVVLAKITGKQFVDSDLVIQEQEGRLLKDIIAEEGVDGFIAVENRINSNLNVQNSVIATGGSVVYGTEAMKHLKEIGTIVYLKVGYKIISGRLSDIKGRGVVLREGQTLHDLYEERIQLYESYADIIVDETGLSIEGTVERIVSELEERNQA